MVDAKKQKELVIRRLTHLDTVTLSQLTRYGHEALGESALDAWMLPVIATCGLLFVGKSGEEIIGSAEIVRCLEEGDLYLEGMYIRPEYQRMGYGASLLSGVFGILSQEAFNRILVTLDPVNEAGRRLYEKSGFSEIDYLPDHYGPGRNRLLMAASLETGTGSRVSDK
ncbi:MAG: GNAT family N-acetyltransferase [Thermoleophilia bacterium]|jgi:ribosomal protein S18 acetylase RimI-like enzyme